MIISKTPYRMSFFGGGTDYKTYFMEHGGSVISTTIDKYCYISLRRQPQFFEHLFHLTYSKVENAVSYDEIKHPSIRECLRYMQIPDLSLAHDGDLPARAGLGTSSSFTVGLLNALHALKGEYKGAMELAQEAIYVEQELMNENVGVQDQIAAAHGGFNRIYFSAEGYEVRPIIMTANRKQDLNSNLMLFFTGVTRVASNIAKEQIDKTQANLSELKMMEALTDESENILTSQVSLNEFGRLMDANWQLKRKLSSKVSNEVIDDIYKKAKKAGATGGKILGAGGGGFILLYVEKEYQQKVKEVLSDLLYVPIQFESLGSRIIYFKQ